MKPALELVHDHAGAVAAGVLEHERRAGDVADELLSLLGAAGHRRVKREAVADCGAVLNTRARPTRFGGRAPSADGAISGRPRASLLDHARARVLARAGARFQERMEARVMGAILTRLGRSPAARSAPATGLHDLEAMQRFASGPGPFAFFDAPSTPAFLFVLFTFHWLLGASPSSRGCCWWGSRS